MPLSNLNSYFKAISLGHNTFDLNFNHPSSFAQLNLYHLLAAERLKVKFPFCIESIPNIGYTLLYTKSGNGLLTYNHQNYALIEHSVILIDASSIYRLEIGTSSSWEFELLLINGPHLLAYYTTYTQNQGLLCPLPPITNLPMLTSKLLSYTTLSSIENDIILSKLVTDLLTELVLARAFNLHHPLNLPPYLSQIKQLFDANYQQHFNLDELAAQYHVSKYKIIRDFTTYLNTSPINYLIERRMIASKKLLLDTNLPIYEIASQVGIDNINHFTNLFKKSVGTTPNHFRKTAQFNTHSSYNQ